MDIYSFVQMQPDALVVSANEHSVPNTEKNDVTVKKETKNSPPEHLPFKIVAELTPQDVYFLKKAKGAALVPTYAMKDKKERIVGAPLSIEADSTREFVDLLASPGVAESYPKGSFNRALEVMY